MTRWLFAILAWLWEIAWRPYRDVPARSFSRRQLEDAAYRIGEKRCRSLSSALPARYRKAWRLLAQHAMVNVEAMHHGAIRKAVLRWARNFDRTKLFEHLIEASILPAGVQGTGTFYVSSVSGDGSDGTTWAKAALTITAGLAFATDATFNFLYVDSAHTVTPAAAITWNVATSGTCVYIVSVDRNGSVTTGDNGLLAGATESVGAASAAFTIGSTTAGVIYVTGVTMNGGTNANAGCTVHIANATVVINVHFTNCTLDCKTTVSNAGIRFGRTGSSGGSFGQLVTLKDCTLKLPSNVGSGNMISFLMAIVEFTNLTIAYSGANKPTSCFDWVANASMLSIVRIRDSDLSGYNTTSGNLFTVTSFHSGEVTVINCKLSGTPGIVTGTWPAGNRSSITLINTDSADTHNVFSYYNRLGTITVNTSNYRNNGAQFDGAGASWQIVTTASCSEQEPFITPWIHRWTSATGSQALTLELLRASATDFTHRQVWAEFEVLESASFPNGTLTSTQAARPFETTGVDLTNSAETWTENVANENPQLITTTRTIAEKLLARARLIVGVASETFYLDPCLAIGSQGNNPPTRWERDGAWNAEPGGSNTPPNYLRSPLIGA